MRYECNPKELVQELREIHKNSPNILDVLLFSIGDRSFDERRGIPLSLAYLKGSLVNNGYSVKCLDYAIYGFSNQDIRDILEILNPKLVGLSATAFFKKQLKSVVRAIKSFSIEIPIIVGGYCSLIPDLVKELDCHAVCHGEGDLTVVELADVFLHQNMLTWPDYLGQIKGISFLKDNQIIYTPVKSLIQDLDTIPFPIYDDFNFDIYGKEHAIPFYAQRGCYNRCNFCDIFSFYQKQGIRSMSPKRIVEWIKLQYSHGIHWIVFNDDNFMGKRQFLEDLLGEFYKQDLVGKVKINFQTRVVDIVRFEDLIPKLKPIIYLIEMGFESFSDSQLKRFNKNLTKAQNLRAIDILIKNKIPFDGYYMFLDANTTFPELEENIQTILSLPKIPLFQFKSLFPEYLINYQYSVWCGVEGESSIASIPFLETFEYIIDETESIIPLFLLYRSLKHMEENPSSLSHISEFQRNLLNGLGNIIYPKAEELGKARLKLALKLSRWVFEKSKKFSPNHRKIKKVIEDFNSEVENVLSPIKRMGIDLDELREYG